MSNAVMKLSCLPFEIATHSTRRRHHTQLYVIKQTTAYTKETTLACYFLAKIFKCLMKNCFYTLMLQWTVA